MKKASISDAKNRLSALLDQVRNGHSITIEDRGVPVARLEPLVGPHVDPVGRIARLERQGILRPRAGKPDVKLLRASPPRTRDGCKGSDLVIDERTHGR